MSRFDINVSVSYNGCVVFYVNKIESNDIISIPLRLRGKRSKEGRLRNERY